MSDKEKVKKYRYFGFVVYPFTEDGEQKPGYETREDLARMLRRSFGDFLISPLHAPDEENAHPHYHVIYRHPAPCRLEVARDFVLGTGVDVFSDFLLCLHHPRNYQRYLLHLDNPEKEQFPGGATALDVVNNFPVDLSRDLSQAEKLEIQMDIESFAEEFSIVEYATLSKFLRDGGYREHYWYFSTHTHHFGKFLDSLRNMSRTRQEVDVND